ncbi:Gfo/Idh/MocA family protein [Hufsiella ginkgonis]|uniref:Gfo/Idh/MocA family oxidoreductase n=1 Tax=Hufsiella ginkgonis TaxID=2695274 RepID=A0A7K1XTK5_9SPHI|nr:Gfo/Idh/MocA family oxidoreductase [Hufsiella ginkgonis]MXV14099.1 Gfo/Idh/MocA family oxidoreductase [Hufsiella ginkgonis]
MTQTPNVRWGVLGTAKIAREKVIPAMQRSAFAEVTAIASRMRERAESTAANLGIAKAYGTYRELLDDADIDAVYISLPNHLHVPWAVKCLEAGKHVLCEKPVGLSPAEAEELLLAAGKYPGLKVMEAFMYRFHPQWRQAKQWVTEGAIGDLKVIQSVFSYYNADPANIRNQVEAGGGGLMDIGCYCVSLSRLIFGAEPVRVLGMQEHDPMMGTDRVTSGILDFGTGSSHFTCSTQLMYYQRVNIMGTTGRIEIEVPFNPLPDKAVKVWLHRQSGTEERVFSDINQFTIQADEFSRAILDGTPAPFPLDDAVKNMRVIAQVVKSAAAGAWV